MSPSKMASNFDLVDSLAAFSLPEVMELFETSERNARRWVTERGLYRRKDGLFPICTTVWWWLGHHQRRVNPSGDPDVDLALLAVKFLVLAGFHEFSERMWVSAEILLRVPLSQRIFEDVKRAWKEEIQMTPQ